MMGGEGLSLDEHADPPIDHAEEAAHVVQPAFHEARLRIACAAYPFLSVVDHRQHLAHRPTKAALEDLLHGVEEVGGGHVVVLARAEHRLASHQVPVDQRADVDGDGALALLELGGDVVEGERAVVQVEERKDARLLLG